MWKLYDGGDFYLSHLAVYNGAFAGIKIHW